MTAISDTILEATIGHNTLAVEGFSSSRLKKYINPASLDIPIGSGDIYALEVFLPSINERNLGEWASHRGNIADEIILESDKMYLIEGPKISIPPLMYGMMDAKSTTGRLGLLSSASVENLNEPVFNKVPENYEGKIWFQVRPHAPLILSKDDAIMQMRLRYHKTAPDHRKDLEALYNSDFIGVKDYRSDTPMKNERVFDGNTTLLRASTELVAKMKRTLDPIKFCEENKYDPHKYWSFQVNERYDSIILEPGDLYLLGTLEHLKLNQYFSAKLRPVTQMLSPLIEIHRAGFIDPGFDSTITLEVINNGGRFLLADGHSVSNVDWERLESPASNPYSNVRGHYQKQLSPALPRQFKDYNKIWDMVREDNGL